MNYQKYADKAYKNLKKYGSTIMITHYENGDSEYNPETNEYEGQGTTVTGVALQRRYTLKDIDGTNIKFGDVNFMASLNGKPYQNDVIDFGGKQFTVIWAEPLNLDGNTDIFWTIQAR